MTSGFEGRIKKIEAELTNLKTASEYSSLKSASFSSSFKVRTGLYQINYDPGRTSVMSFVYCDDTGHGSGIVYPRTPSGNVQVIEVNTDRTSGADIITDEANLIIVSNRPVNSVIRL